MTLWLSFAAAGAYLALVGYLLCLGRVNRVSEVRAEAQEQLARKSLYPDASMSEERIDG